MNARDREQRHHDMSSTEEHYLLAWLREHQPAAFDAGADYVDRIRHLDTDHIRKEARP